AVAIARIQGHWFGVGNATYRIADNHGGPSDTVPYGCFRRSVFQEVGMFNERLVRGQDLELNARIRSHGGSVWLEPQLTCFYHPPWTWGDFLVKQFRTGQWVVYQAVIASSKTLGLRHFVPLAFVIGLVIAGLLAAFNMIAGALLLTAIGLPYLVLMLYAI